MTRRILASGAALGLLLLGIDCARHPAVRPAARSFLNRYGGDRMDRGVAVRETEDGGIVVVGLSTSFSDNGDEDVFLLLTDGAGGERWRRTYGGSGRDNGWDVLPLEDGGLLVAGFSNSFGEGDFDAYALRLDVAGAVLWERTFGGSGDEYIWAAARTADGGFLLAGETGPRGVYGEGERDFYAVKIDREGRPLWERSYGGPQTDRAFAVAASPEGFLLLGATNGSGAGDWDAYLVEIDAQGTERWSRTYGTERFDMGHDVSATPDGGLLLVGYTESYGASGKDVWMVKTDGSGAPLWMKTIGGPGDDRAVRGVCAPDGGFALMGYTRPSEQEEWDTYLVRTDASGSVLWTRNHGSPGQDSGYGIGAARDGGFIFTGWALASGPGDFDLILGRTGDDGRIPTPGR